MHRRSAIAFALLLAGGTALGYSPRAFGQNAWDILFDGSNANNFELVGNANWRLVNRLLQADVGNGFLVSKKDYANFQLRVEFWVDTTANSGIFIRCTDPKKISGGTGYEVNIFDTRPDPTYGTGAIVGVAKVNPMPRAANRWNSYEIIASGDTFTVTLNGIKTVDGAKDDKRAKGRIALQYGAGIVKFRRVELLPL